MIRKTMPSGLDPTADTGLPRDKRDALCAKAMLRQKSPWQPYAMPDQAKRARHTMRDAPSTNSIGA
jgi:hypothetical protein